MDRRQYLAISWFFLILAVIFLITHQFFFGLTSPSILKESLTPYDIYHNVRLAMINVIGMVYLSLFILFQILGRLEPKRK